jgi:hypothetical protein
MEYIRVDGRMILGYIRKAYNVRVWIGIIWLRVGISSRLL